MNPRIARITGIAGLVIASCIAATLQAQGVEPQSRATGLLIGVGAESNVIGRYPGRTASRDANTGGQTFIIGYAFTPKWALNGQIGKASYENSDGGNGWAGSMDLTVRRHFRASASRFVPFALAGVSSRVLALLGTSTETPGRAYNGLGFRMLPDVGGGANFHVARSVAVTTSASMNFGKFDTRYADGTSRSSLRATTPRLSLGVLLTPGALRKK